jgi:hypothetical protein
VYTDSDPRFQIWVRKNMQNKDLFNQIGFKGGSHRKRRSHRKRKRSHKSHNRNTRRRMGGVNTNYHQLPPRPMSRVIQPDGPDFELPEYGIFRIMSEHIIEHPELLPGLRQGIQRGIYLIIQQPGVAVELGQVYHIIARQLYEDMSDHIMRVYQRRARELSILDGRKIT